MTMVAVTPRSLWDLIAVVVASWLPHRRCVCHRQGCRGLVAVAEVIVVPLSRSRLSRLPRRHCLFDANGIGTR
ncbi:hypothetical protein EDB85DRAFT_1906209 [Lactarius pseudohatsudake]|nr:hypothetical protein EDB85DRAFT_1906209 [Lactarius pseudohatsudake]